MDTCGASIAVTVTISKYTPLMPLLAPAQLEAVVDTFYDRVYAHPWIGRFFGAVDQDIQAFNLVRFIQVSWSDEAYPTRQAQFIQQVHAHMFITEELFALREDLFAEALRHHGHGEDMVEAFHDFDRRWRDQVVKGSVEECSDALAEIVVHPRPESAEGADHGAGR